MTATYLKLSEIVSRLQQSGHPVDLYAARYIEELCDLLAEALECVDADEQARFESWPQEVECGDLTLDLGDRIREALGCLAHNESQDVPSKSPS